MTVFNKGIDPHWPEELLTITLLNEKNRRKRELIDSIRHIQKPKIAPFKPHSESAYNYWFRALKDRGIIVEKGGVFSLTGLGRWVAAGSIGSLFMRNQFANLICDKCSNENRIVLRTLLMNTMTDNKKGDPFLDVECLECGSISSQNNLGSIATKDSIVKVYNEALAEMRLFFTVVGKPIEE